MQGQDDTRRRGTKIDIEDSLDDAEHMEKRQEQQRNKRYRRGERQAPGDSKIVGREQARERLSVDGSMGKQPHLDQTNCMPLYARDDEALSVKNTAIECVVALHAACETIADGVM